MTRCKFSNGIFTRCSVQKIKRKYLQIPSNCHIFESFGVYRCQLQSKQLTKHNKKRNIQQEALEIVSLTLSYK